ncbi:hypothetical protein H4219_002061 [Mycoemilia scoparia]|uniref:Uncharacterized protein n=1 Tax=Mycoemilia scoparia TaxID=417184 RepID=A0A9W8A7W3_9FUNG|nr:hypothetical protein H4219_002061 [Mycoemilia scoparia]
MDLFNPLPSSTYDQNTLETPTQDISNYYTEQQTNGEFPFPPLQWPNNRGSGKFMDVLEMGKTSNMCFLGKETSTALLRKQATTAAISIAHQGSSSKFWWADQNVRLKSKSVWKPKSGLYQLQPPTRVHKINSHRRKDKFSTKLQISRLSTHYTALGIDFRTIESVLEKDRHYELARTNYDLSVGNLLTSFRPWNWNSEEFGCSLIPNPIPTKLERGLNLLDLDKPLGGYDIEGGEFSDSGEDDDDDDNDAGLDNCFGDSDDDEFKVFRTLLDKGKSSKRSSRKAKSKSSDNSKSSRYASRSWVAMPTGLQSKGLRVYPCPSPNDTVEARLRNKNPRSNDRRFEHRIISEYMTPIRELATIPKDPRLLAVRSMGGINIVATFEMVSPLGAPNIEALTLPTQYSYAEANQWVINMSPNKWNVADMALSSSDNSIHIWNYNNQTVECLRQSDPYLENENEWSICQYWNTPKSFLVCDSRALLSLDSRTSTQRNTTIMFDVNDFINSLPTSTSKNYDSKEYITAICPSEFNPLHAAMCTNKYLRIFDQRYTKSPIITWSHSFLPHDPPRFMLSVKNDVAPDCWPCGTGSFIISSRVNGKSAVYTYGPSGGLSLPCSGYDQSSLVPFSYHNRVEANSSANISSDVDWFTPWKHIKPNDFNVAPGLSGIAVCKAENDDDPGLSYYVFQLASDNSLYGQTYSAVSSQLDQSSSSSAAVVSNMYSTKTDSNGGVENEKNEEVVLNSSGEKRIMFKDWYFDKKSGLVMDGTDTCMFTKKKLGEYSASLMNDEVSELCDYRRMDIRALYKFACLGPDKIMESIVGRLFDQNEHMDSVMSAITKGQSGEVNNNNGNNDGGDDAQNNSEDSSKLVPLKTLKEMVESATEDYRPGWYEGFKVDEALANELLSKFNENPDRISELALVSKIEEEEEDVDMVMETQMSEDYPSQNISSRQGVPVNSATLAGNNNGDGDGAADRNISIKPSTGTFSSLYKSLSEKHKTDDKKMRISDKTLNALASDIWLSSVRIQAKNSQGAEKDPEDEMGLGETSKTMALKKMGEKSREYKFTSVLPKNTEIKLTKAALGLSRTWEKLPSNAFDLDSAVRDGHGYTSASDSQGGYSSSGISSYSVSLRPVSSRHYPDQLQQQLQSQSASQRGTAPTTPRSATSSQSFFPTTPTVRKAPDVGSTRTTRRRRALYSSKTQFPSNSMISSTSNSPIVGSQQVRAADMQVQPGLASSARKLKPVPSIKLEPLNVFGSPVGQNLPDASARPGPQPQAPVIPQTPHRRHPNALNIMTTGPGSGTTPTSKRRTKRPRVSGF